MFFQRRKIKLEKLVVRTNVRTKEKFFEALLGSKTHVVELPLEAGEFVGAVVERQKVLEAAGVRNYLWFRSERVDVGRR